MFSAVLTAFVVETYSLLQQDSGQTTNQLLVGISRQLGGASSTVPNDTPTLSSSPAFTPSAAARWINILFFLSLVSSLSAALFGILAKQWLREYMQWNSTLGVPRDNVLVRQVRFEAWEAWNISATISSIPALLELSMILFLVGIVILLWTLDAIVAITITTSVAIFMGVVLAFTALPVFFKRCPYKSPTAWAFVVLSGIVSDAAVYVLRFCVEYVRNLRYRYWRLSAVYVPWPKRPRNWRERDQIRGMGGQDLHPQARWMIVPKPMRRSLEHALFAETVGLTDTGELVEQPRSGFAAVPASKAAITDLREVALLFRALAWVYKASQDTRVRQHIVQSMESIHSILPVDVDNHGVMNVSDWCLLWALQSNSLRQPELALSPSGDGKAGITAVQLQVRRMWVSQRLETSPYGPLDVSRLRQRVIYGSMNLRVPADHAPLLAHLVAADLRASVHALQATTSNPRITEISPSSGRLILELLCVLGCLCTSRSLPISNLQIEGIRNLVCSTSIRRYVDSAFPGLRSSALLLACRLARVESKDNNFSGKRRCFYPGYAIISLTSYAAQLLPKASVWRLWPTRR